MDEAGLLDAASVAALQRISGALEEEVGVQLAVLVVPTLEEEDPKALAEGITKLWADPEMRARFGAAARQRIRDIFNVEQGTAKTLQVYRELAGR